MPTKLWEPPRAAKSSTNDEAGFRPRTIAIAGLLAGGALLAILLSAWDRRDFRAMFDEQVDETWIADRDLTHATEFFSKGGVFKNLDESGTLDQKYVIPLIKRLEQEFQLEFQVILDKSLPNRAYALIARVPRDRKPRNAIRAAILQAADDFPGLLYQKWGHHWLSLDFFDEQDITPLKQSNALPRLKASQRIMD